MAKTKLQKFYDQYHQKNKQYYKVIGEPNFTYFYIQKLVKKYAPVPLPGVITDHSCNNRSLPGLKILDVGCAVGAMAFWLARNGAKVTGIDVSPRAIKIANQAKSSLAKQNPGRRKWLKNLNFKLGQLTLNKSKNNSKYDLILATEIIEHVENDSNFLKKIRSNLKTGGILILTTPSPDNWWYKLGWLDKFDQQVGHLRRYSRQELTEILNKNGFKIIKIQQKEGSLRTILYNNKYLSYLIYLIKGPLIPIFHWVDDLFSLVTGGTDWQVIAKNSINHSKFN